MSPNPVTSTPGAPPTGHTEPLGPPLGAPASPPALVHGLEPGQLVTALRAPLPRQHLTTTQTGLLWTVRLLLLLLTAMVVYTFVHAL